MAIGSAYAVGALALGAFLVIGFALHNTTEGLAIVAPVADAAVRRRGSRCSGSSPARRRSSAPGSAPRRSTAVAAFLFGFGAGAIVQVIVQLAPTLRDDEGRTLHPAPWPACWPGWRSCSRPGCW